MKKVTIDPPEIIHPPSPEHPWVRRKYVCMTVTDWTSFGDALAEALPDAIYIRGVRPMEAIQPEPPIIRAERHLCTARVPDPDFPDGVRFPSEITMYIDPKAELSIGRSGGLTKPKTGRWYASGGISWPRIRFLPTATIWPADARGPEHIGEGEIQIYIAPHHKGHARFMRQIFRLLSKFATNERQTLVRYPHYEVIPEEGRPLFGLWIGHDAMRWAREDPKRFLAYSPSALSRRSPDNLGYGYRPKDP